MLWHRRSPVLGSPLLGSMLLGSMLLALTVCLSGCGWFGDEEQKAEPVDEKIEMPTTQAPPPAEKLELNLSQGQKFPLVKTVIQTLKQPVGDGIAESRSHLKLWLTIDVEKIQPDGMKLLGVKYHRVMYSHDVGGKHVEFHSGTLQEGPLPLQVQAYYGLVNNGFAFWLGADNQIRKTVGFEEFLQRCVRNVGKEHQQEVLTMLEQTAGNDGIANFVDDSIGLLPYHAEGSENVVQIGDSWNRNRSIPEPVPMNVQTTFTLKKLDSQLAHVEVSGQIHPPQDWTPKRQAGVLVKLVRGQTIGHSLIERATGLPRHSDVQRKLDLLVELQNGASFVQQKLITTRVETYTQPENSKPIQIGKGPAKRGNIQQTSGIKN